MRQWMMAVAVAVAIAAPAAWAASWSTVRDAEAGFTIQLPGDPKIARKGPGPDPKDFLQVQYSLTGAEGSYYVTATKFGATLTEDQLTGALDRSVAAGSNATGNTETSRRSFRFDGGVQARDAEFSNGTRRGWIRVFYHDGWLCTAVITLDVGQPTASATRALASFAPMKTGA